MLCSLTVWQWILLYHLPRSRVNRVLLEGYCSIKCLVYQTDQESKSIMCALTAWMTWAAVTCRRVSQSGQGDNCSNTKQGWGRNIGSKVRDHSTVTRSWHCVENIYWPFTQMGAAVVTVCGLKLQLPYLSTVELTIKRESVGDRYSLAPCCSGSHCFQCVMT